MPKKRARVEENVSPIKTLDISTTAPPRLLRVPEVMNRMGVKRTQMFVLRDEGTLTEPIVIGRLTLWPEHEINALIRARIAGKTADELRELVQQLTAARKEVA